MSGSLDDGFVTRSVVPEPEYSVAEIPFEGAGDLEVFFVNYLALLNMKRFQENGQHLNLLSGSNKLDVPPSDLKELITEQSNVVIGKINRDATGTARVLFEWHLLRSLASTIPENLGVGEEYTTWSNLDEVREYEASLKKTIKRDNRTLAANLDIISASNAETSMDEMEEDIEEPSLAYADKEDKDDGNVATRPGGERTEQRAQWTAVDQQRFRKDISRDLILQEERRRQQEMKDAERAAEQKQEQESLRRSKRQTTRSDKSSSVPGYGDDEEFVVSVNTKQKATIDADLESLGAWIKENRGILTFNAYRFIEVNNQILIGSGLKPLKVPSPDEKVSTTFLSRPYVSSYIAQLAKRLYEDYNGAVRFIEFIYVNLEAAALGNPLPLFRRAANTRHTEPRESRNPAVDEWLRIRGNVLNNIKRLRAFINKYNLDITTSGPGRTKEAIFDDIESALGITS